MLYSKKMTKSHNSCKTCNIAKSCLYGHLHVMLVTVCGYEQNPSRGVGGVAHTRVMVVPDGRTYVRRSVHLNAHPQTHKTTTNTQKQQHKNTRKHKNARKHKINTQKHLQTQNKHTKTPANTKHTHKKNANTKHTHKNHPQTHNIHKQITRKHKNNHTNTPANTNFTNQKSRQTRNTPTTLMFYLYSLIDSSFIL